ncbi:MAG: CHAT domain-containing protein [Pseudomonadota bacterium]
MSSEAALQPLDKEEGRRRAAASYSAAIELWPEGQFEELKLFAVLNLSGVLHRQTDNLQAVSVLETVYDVTNERWRPLVHNHAASLTNLLNDEAATLRHLCTSIRIVVASGDCSPSDRLAAEHRHAPFAADAFNRMGLYHHRRGELDQASEWYENALLHAPDWFLFLRALIANNLGGIHYIRGDVSDALHYFDESYQKNAEAGDFEGQALALGNQASAHRLVANYDDAINRQLQALQIYQDLDDRSGAALTTHRIGLLYLELRNLTEAAQFLQRGLELQQTYAPNQVASSHAELGRLSELRDNTKEAEYYYQAALSAFSSANLYPRMLQVQMNLARLYLENGQHQAAVELLARAIEVADDIGDQRTTGRLMALRGEHLHRTGQLAQAETAFDQALRLHRRSGDTIAQVSTLYLKAMVLAEAGCRTCALETLTAAEALLEQSRLGVSNPELRASFTGEYANVYGAHVDLLMAEKAHEEALELAINKRTRVLLETITSKSLAGSNTGASTRALREQLVAKSEAKLRLERLWPNSQALTSLEDEIAEIILRLDAIEADELAGRIGETHHTSLAALQARIPERSAILAYWVDEEATWSWLIEKTRISHRRITSRRELQALISQMHQDFNIRRRYPSPVMHELSAALIPEELETSDLDQLIVIPDDVTAQVPFSALLGPDVFPIVETTEVVVLPVAAMLFRDQRDSDGNGALVIADPVFGDSDSRATGLQVPSQFDRLPHTATEAASVSASLEAGFEVERLEGFRASKAQLAASDLSKVNILHIATHGLVDTERPQLSGLVLTQLDESGNEQSGLLSLAEIYDLELNAELVVLSACDTGVGKQISGEGPISLARGFLIGGAQQVVASLWQVSDLATAELMSAFYRHLMQGMSASSALQASQLELRAKRRWSHPYYWSGFMVVGVAPEQG